jgi:hypothetical protein
MCAVSRWSRSKLSLNLRLGRQTCQVNCVYTHNTTCPDPKLSSTKMLWALHRLILILFTFVHLIAPVPHRHVQPPSHSLKKTALTYRKRRRIDCQFPKDFKYAYQSRRRRQDDTLPHVQPTYLNHSTVDRIESSSSKCDTRLNTLFATHSNPVAILC